MICQIKKFFCPFSIFWYKFLSYIEVLHVLSELSKLLELSELIELPEVFSSMKNCLFCGALRLGDPLIKLLELRLVSSSSETSRSSGTIQTSQSSISSHPAFPDESIGTVETCNDQFPQRQESPQGLADLGSAIGLAPQSPGLLGGLRDGMGVS